MSNNKINQLLAGLRSYFAANKTGNAAINDAAFETLFRALYGDILLNDPLLDLIQSNANRRSVIYDIGTSYGSYSIYLAHKVAGARVYAFEPLPQAYQHLADNIDRFGLKDRITTFNAAVSDMDGKSIFYISSDSARSSLHQYNACGCGSKIITSISVDSYTIDMLVRSKKCHPPDIMKVDTEGHEYEVLKGAEQVL